MNRQDEVLAVGEQLGGRQRPKRTAPKPGRPQAGRAVSGQLGRSGESAQAERDKSLREKQWAAYEEILGILDDRQAYRLEVMNKARTAKADGTDIKSFISIATKLADFHDSETRGARGRLMAYASPKVRTAFLQMITDDTAMGLTAVTRTVALATRTIALYAQHQTRS